MKLTARGGKLVKGKAGGAKRYYDDTSPNDKDFGTILIERRYANADGSDLNGSWWVRVNTLPEGVDTARLVVYRKVNGVAQTYKVGPALPVEATFVNFGVAPDAYVSDEDSEIFALEPLYQGVPGRPTRVRTVSETPSTVIPLSITSAPEITGTVTEGQAMTLVDAVYVIDPNATAVPFFKVATSSGGAGAQEVTVTNNIAPNRSGSYTYVAYGFRFSGAGVQGTVESLSSYVLINAQVVQPPLVLSQTQLVATHQLPYKTLSVGTVAVRTTVSGVTSGATGTLVEELATATGIMYLANVTGTFLSTENLTVTGGTAKADGAQEEWKPTVGQVFRAARATWTGTSTTAPAIQYRINTVASDTGATDVTLQNNQMPADSVGKFIKRCDRGFGVGVPSIPGYIEDATAWLEIVAVSVRMLAADEFFIDTPTAIDATTEQMTAYYTRASRNLLASKWTTATPEVLDATAFPANTEDATAGTESSFYMLYYDQATNTTGFETEGATLTGGTSGHTATIFRHIELDAGTTGVFIFEAVSGTFQDNESLTCSNGAAKANGVATLVPFDKWDIQPAIHGTPPFDFSTLRDGIDDVRRTRFRVYGQEGSIWSGRSLPKTVSNAPAATNSRVWQRWVMRLEGQFLIREIGGTGMQFVRNWASTPADPGLIVAGIDITRPMGSYIFGDYWISPRLRHMFANMSSMGVLIDDYNPNHWLVYGGTGPNQTNAAWNNLNGVYLSTDKGQVATQVLSLPDSSGSNRGDRRTLHHCLAKAPIVKGTGSGYLVNHGGTYSVGATTIAADTGTGTILAGDIVRFAGDTNDYEVATALSAGSFTIVSPGLVQTLADNVAITVVSSAANKRTVYAAHSKQTWTPNSVTGFQLYRSLQGGVSGSWVAIWGAQAAGWIGAAYGVECRDLGSAGTHDVYVYGDGGIKRRANGASAWTDCVLKNTAGGSAITGVVLHLVTRGTKMWCVVEGVGLYECTDGVNFLRILSGNYSAFEVSRVKKNSKYRIFVFSHSGSVAARWSDDEGATWTHTNPSNNQVENNVIESIEMYGQENTFAHKVGGDAVCAVAHEEDPDLCVVMRNQHMGKLILDTKNSNGNYVAQWASRGYDLSRIQAISWGKNLNEIAFGATDRGVFYSDHGTRYTHSMSYANGLKNALWKRITGGTSNSTEFQDYQAMGSVILENNGHIRIVAAMGEGLLGGQKIPVVFEPAILNKTKNKGSGTGTIADLTNIVVPKGSKGGTYELVCTAAPATFTLYAPSEAWGQRGAAIGVTNGSTGNQSISGFTFGIPSGTYAAGTNPAIYTWYYNPCYQGTILTGATTDSSERGSRNPTDGSKAIIGKNRISLDSSGNVTRTGALSYDFASYGKDGCVWAQNGNNIMRNPSETGTWSIAYSPPGAWNSAQKTINRLQGSMHVADRCYRANNYGQVHRIDGGVATEIFNFLTVMATIEPGATFAGTGTPARPGCTGVTEDPFDPLILHVSVDFGGTSTIFKTVDGGTTWTDLTASEGLLQSGTIFCCPYTGDVAHVTQHGTGLVGTDYSATLSDSLKKQIDLFMGDTAKYMGL